ncbi:MAG TPA: hypothetical protein VL442_10805 [Mucilaginibacter sp.]|jgi:hypothetical protein|nr:hypothetical protein [Mucilaginibacter sp.]
MDLAVYISELLGLEGEVNVPGIGRFAQSRINGYYNEKENKFYPPTHKINFNAEAQANDRLAAFISDKKNISLASAKYFIDKYVNGLKQQIPVQKVDIAGLGELYLNGSAIGFSENAPSKETDAAFFGLKPVSVDVLVEKPSVRYTPPPVKIEEEIKAPSIADQVMTELVNDRIPPPPPKPLVIEKPTVIEEAEEPVAEEYIYEETARKNNNNTWIAVLLLLIIALLALMGLYKYKPEWFDRSKEKPETFVAVDTTTAKPAESKVNNTDTTKTVATATKQDSLAKAQALVTGNTNTNTTVDTAATRWEVIGSSFETQAAAEHAIENYKSIGLEAKIVADAPGKRIKLTLGTYKTEKDAEDARAALIKTGKVKKDIYTLKIKPKQ